MYSRGRITLFHYVNNRKAVKTAAEMFTTFIKQANNDVGDKIRRFYHAIICSTKCNERNTFI